MHLEENKQDWCAFQNSSFSPPPSRGWKRFPSCIYCGNSTEGLEVKPTILWGLIYDWVPLKSGWFFSLFKLSVCCWGRMVTPKLLICGTGNHSYEYFCDTSYILFSHSLFILYFGVCVYAKQCAKYWEYKEGWNVVLDFTGLRFWECLWHLLPEVLF